jgi:hypothetical protein
MRKIIPKNLLIGSASIHWWFPEFRKPRDYDIYAIDDSIIDDFRKKNPRCKIRQNKSRYLIRIPGLPKIEVTVHYPESAIDLWVIANRSSVITEIGGIYLKVARPTTMLLIKRIHSSCGADTAKKRKNQEDLVFLESKVHENPTDMEIKAYEKRLGHIKNIVKRRQSCNI